MINVLKFYSGAGEGAAIVSELWGNIFYKDCLKTSSHRVLCYKPIDWLNAKGLSCPKYVSIYNILIHETIECNFKVSTGKLKRP